jgi:hypothetical protein
MNDTIPAVSLEFMHGRVQMFVGGRLRLEAPYKYGKPAPTLETDKQLKQCSVWLLEDDSDDLAVMLGGNSTLVGAGFKQGDDSV